MLQADKILMPNLELYFSADGILSRHISGYRTRSQQMEMARAIADTIAKNGILVAEAGTGTGKTFAYLVPALLAGGKVILSTGTKTLQDQLYKRDIPTIRAALDVPKTISILKGRANYICHYHLKKTLSDEAISFSSQQEIKFLHLIENYARRSKTGDKSSLHKVPEDAPIWHQVTSTRENCLGSDCPDYKQCFVMEARKKALSSDIVIVNHHLFFADVMLRDEGVSELLPACNTVIFDEAHQLPETASLFFGESVSTSQLLMLARDTTIEVTQHANDFPGLLEAIDSMEQATRELRLTIPAEHTRLSSSLVKRNMAFYPALNDLMEKLTILSKMLESQAGRAEGLENCWQRATDMLLRIKHWNNQDETDEYVRWIEVFSQALQLNATPLSIAEIFTKQIHASPRAWIFTSATLSVKNDFSHYCHEMGLTAAQSISWDSPFDFSKQSLLYVPTGLPEPNTRQYTNCVVNAALPVLQASQGRAFFLCTSLQAMQQIYELLLTAFKQTRLNYPLLLQGQESRSKTLDKFRNTQHAVLIGSQSFWEGVDVKGEALSVVIIDKLPFASPNDPVLSARIDKINKEGRNAFMEYQLPRAIINLKQGAGRLIRDENDRGVLMICDPRIITKSYGRKIWQSLPPMKRTRKLADVEQFFLTDS